MSGTDMVWEPVEMKTVVRGLVVVCEPESILLQTPDGAVSTFMLADPTSLTRMEPVWAVTALKLADIL